jgi:ABC-type branched-subunit amino acid transport system permease subunit
VTEVETIALAAIGGVVAAQFLVRAVTSFIVDVVFLSSFRRSKVDKANSVFSFTASMVQTVAFAALLYMICGLLADRLDFTAWTPATIAFGAAAAAASLHALARLPGEVRLARLCAWEPGFAEDLAGTPRTRYPELLRVWRQTGLH